MGRPARRIEGGQAFQAKGALPAQGTGRGGDGQAHLARAGDHDAHAVLEQIGADGHVQAFRRPAQRLGGTGRGQRHGDGFGAAQGGHHYLIQQGQDGLPVGKRQTHAFSGPEAHDVEGWRKGRETGSRGQRAAAFPGQHGAASGAAFSADARSGIPARRGTHGQPRRGKDCRRGHDRTGRARRQGPERACRRAPPRQTMGTEKTARPFPPGPRPARAPVRHCG